MRCDNMSNNKNVHDAAMDNRIERAMAITAPWSCYIMYADLGTVRYGGISAQKPRGVDKPSSSNAKPLRESLGLVRIFLHCDHTENEINSIAGRVQAVKSV